MTVSTTSPGSPAFLFDLDGTLVDSVYQHVLAWRDALEQAGLPLAVWRIHRRIGMSGGLFVNALARERHSGHNPAARASPPIGGKAREDQGRGRPRFRGGARALGDTRDFSSGRGLDSECRYWHDLRCS
jgi:hypothetical protein